MHIARGIGVGPGDLSGERLDEGNREVAGACRGTGQINEIERGGLASFRDRTRGTSGDHAGRSLGARERRFKIEHVLQIGRVIADRAHGGARQHWSEHRGERSAHDARDLTILFRPCQSQSANPKCFKSPLRCEYASLVARCPPSFWGLRALLEGTRRSDRWRRPMAMTMNGEVQLAAPREVVWTKLNDPEVLKVCIPGCEELEKTDDTNFRAVAKMKVGPVS